MRSMRQVNHLAPHALNFFDIAENLNAALNARLAAEVFKSQSMCGDFSPKPFRHPGAVRSRQGHA